MKEWLQRQRENNFKPKSVYLWITKDYGNRREGKWWHFQTIKQLLRSINPVDPTSNNTSQIWSSQNYYPIAITLSSWSPCFYFCPLRVHYPQSSQSDLFMTWITSLLCSNPPIILRIKSKLLRTAYMTWSLTASQISSPPASPSYAHCTPATLGGLAIPWAHHAQVQVRTFNTLFSHILPGLI